MKGGGEGEGVSRVTHDTPCMNLTLGINDCRSKCDGKDHGNSKYFCQFWLPFMAREDCRRHYVLNSEQKNAAIISFFYSLLIHRLSSLWSPTNCRRQYVCFNLHAFILHPYNGCIQKTLNSSTMNFVVSWNSKKSPSRVKCSSFCPAVETCWRLLFRGVHKSTHL